MPWVIEGARAMTSTTTSTATNITRRHPGYGYIGIVALGRQHCYLTTSKQWRSSLASTGRRSSGREEEVHQKILVEEIAPMEYSFQGPGIGYPVVEFARDLISLHASSVVGQGRDNVSNSFLSIESSRSCGVID